MRTDKKRVDVARAETQQSQHPSDATNSQVTGRPDARVRRQPQPDSKGRKLIKRLDFWPVSVGAVATVRSVLRSNFSGCKTEDEAAGGDNRR